MSANKTWRACAGKLSATKDLPELAKVSTAITGILNFIEDRFDIREHLGVGRAAHPGWIGIEALELLRTCGKIQSRGMRSAIEAATMAAFDQFSAGVLEVKLDGVSIEVPPDRRSFVAIRSYLETLALQQQRILCALNVDGQSVNLTHPRLPWKSFSHIEGETMSLNEVPVQLIRAALQQTTSLRVRVQSAVELVLINDIGQAREIWWGLSSSLKEPLLTLSLLPDSVCGPANGRASLTQLRKWQLEQLGGIIQDIDDASRTDDTNLLSDALEKRALPWLDRLLESLALWNETIGSTTTTATSTCPRAN